MNYPFSYTVPVLYAKYKQIRNITFWAGGLGVAQALIMMGLTITGILAYTCVIPAPAETTFGNLISYTFYTLYFKGDCDPDNYVTYNYTILTTVPTVQNPQQLLIWQCVYLGVATIWLISSILLLSHVKKQDPKLTLANLSGWTTFTFLICALDLTLGIIFGIDYGNFHAAALSENFVLFNGNVDPNNMQLVAASVVALSLSIVSLKGYILWLINFGLVIYFIVVLCLIGTSKDSNDTLFIPGREDNDDILATQPPPPINAYDDKSQLAAKSAAEYTNVAYVDVPESRYTPPPVLNQTSPPVLNQTSPPMLNQASIARAARISTDVQLNERRFRNLDNFQQYPPLPPQYPNQADRPVAVYPPNNNNNNINSNSNNNNSIPMPDYSPQMVRSNQRYQ